jgi:hypothetical protein
MTLPNPDLFRAYCATAGYRQTYNEGLYDWLHAEGFTQATLNDKIAAASAASFDWVLN